MRNLFLFISVMMVVTGCFKHGVPDKSVDLDNISNSVFHTKSEYSIKEDDSYFVTERDIANYVHFRQLECKSRGRDLKLESITPIEWDSVACLYALQYQDGYDIISSDKRSPIPIAYNKRGVLQLDDEREGFLGHLNLIAEQIWYSLKGYGETPGSELTEEVKGSLDFWKMVSAESSFIEQFSEPTKSHIPTDPPEVPTGHWELVEVDSFEQVFDTIPHLTVTQWYQLGCYNLYCPKYSPDNPLRCPAGCVAIAGAQMLFFLHGKDGIPVNSPSQGSCTGYVSDSTYVQTFSNPSSNTWSHMTLPRGNHDVYAARLIGDVGKRLHTDYQNDGSGAVFRHLKDSVFNHYGWNCSHTVEYNSTDIVTSLLSGYPVLCSGSRSNRGVDSIRHAFLIDSYQRSRLKTISYYEWVYDNPSANSPIPLRREVTYSSPYVSHYRMNWGQMNTDNNETWCSLEGIWQYGDLPPYSSDREMLYNFTIINE